MTKASKWGRVGMCWHSWWSAPATGGLGTLWWGTFSTLQAITTETLPPCTGVETRDRHNFVLENRVEEREV